MYIIHRSFVNTSILLFKCNYITWCYEIVYIYINIHIESYRHIHKFKSYLVGGLPTPLYIYKSVGMIIPNIWKVIKFMFQTTNQIFIDPWYSSHVPRSTSKSESLGRFGPDISGRPVGSRCCVSYSWASNKKWLWMAVGYHVVPG